MFYVKEAGKVKTEGCWDQTIIEVYENDKKIGEYLRNYSSFGESTFHPFKMGDKWYAIYSENYTSTSIMSLPDCKKIGGELDKATGFCPVDYYIPKYYNHTIPGATEEELKTIPEENRHWAKLDATYRIYDKCGNILENKIHYDLRFGFVAGCYWSDDSGGWKLQRLDLTEADKGIIKRSEDFGYIELHPGKLSEIIEINDGWHDPDKLRFCISVLKYYDLENGGIKSVG